MNAHEYYSLGCGDERCNGFLVGRFDDDLDQGEYIPIFRSKELAEIDASEEKDEHGNTPKVIRITITRHD